MQVVAPASTANMGPGFDVFGLALDAYHDTIHMEKTTDNHTSIISNDAIPLDATSNTAGIVVCNMREEYAISDGIRITIQKGVPAGYGMGSSAASAAAAAVAFDALYNLGLSSDTLVRHAGYGEKAAAGTIHYDNVAASIYGGFVVVRPDPFGVVHIRAPDQLAMCVATPNVRTPSQKTKVSRGVIPDMIPLEQMTHNLACASCMVAGFATGDIRTIFESMNDVVVEPARRHMIPGFDRIRDMALEAGAGAVCISGAGPSVIAFADGTGTMDGIESAMRRGFDDAEVPCTTVRCRPATGAHRV